MSRGPGILRSSRYSRSRLDSRTSCSRVPSPEIVLPNLRAGWHELWRAYKTDCWSIEFHSTSATIPYDHQLPDSWWINQLPPLTNETLSSRSQRRMYLYWLLALFVSHYRLLWKKLEVPWAHLALYFSCVAAGLCWRVDASTSCEASTTTVPKQG